MLSSTYDHMFACLLLSFVSRGDDEYIGFTALYGQPQRCTPSCTEVVLARSLYRAVNLSIVRCSAEVASATASQSLISYHLSCIVQFEDKRRPMHGANKFAF